MTDISSLPDFTHERVEVVTGPRSGLVVTVAVHSTALGPALGVLACGATRIGALRSRTRCGFPRR